MKLEDVNWNHFKVGNLFSIDKCKCKKAGDLDAGKTPYVGATNKQNGVMSFVKKNEKLLSQGNAIAFICDGQGSVGYSIYKYEKFIGSTTLKAGRSDFLNKYNGLFISTALDMNKSIYDYGYKRNDSRLKNETISLPSCKNEPDYEYMEKYSKSTITEKLENYKRYAQSILDKLDFIEIESFEDKEWGEFFLTDIMFKIQRGKRLTKANQKAGNKPYISSTAINNGVDNFIGNEDGVRVFFNCLTIANSGSVGSSFYHPYEFVASDHVTHLANDSFNENIYMFITTMLNRLSEKYNFNREINDNRISREKILLPIGKDGEPDYGYMEQYIKNVKYKKLKQYLTYIEKTYAV